mgnify:CR=1 FL=1
MDRFFCVLFLIMSLLYQKTEVQGQNVYNDSIKMSNHYNAALILYSQGFYTQALDSFKYAFETGKMIYGENHYNLRNINNALGVTYRNIGQYENAIRHFLLAEQSLSGDPGRNEMAVARLYNNIGNVYYNRFNYGIALEYYQRSVDIFLDQKKVDNAEVARIYYSIANIHFKLGNFEKSLEIILKHSSQAFPQTKLYFMNLKAAALQMLEDFDRAYESYNDAIRYAKEIYRESDSRVVFQYLNFATYLIAVKDFDKALEILDNVNKIFTELINGKTQ